MKRATMIALGLFGALCAVSHAAAPKPDVAALVDKMPAFAANSMFEGPARADAEKLFEQVLAGGAPAVVAVVDMLAPPPAENFKPRYVLHGMAQWLGDDKLADKRRVFVGALASTLGSQRPKWVQGFVACQLQTVGDADAALALGKLLSDEDLCDYAVGALSAIGGPAAAGELRKALPQAKGRCRMAAIRGLGETGDVASAGELVKALADPERDVRITAAQALGRIGDAGGIDAMLKAAAEAKTPFERAQVADACMALGRCLAKAGKKAEAKRVLLHLCNNDKSPHVQCAAMEGLGLVAADDALAAIIAAARGADRRIAVAAVQAAVASGHWKLCWDRLKDAPADSRLAYLRLLARKGGYCAMPFVNEGMKDPSAEFGKASAEAIGLMTDCPGQLVRDVLRLIAQKDQPFLGELIGALKTLDLAAALKEQVNVEQEMADALPEAPGEAKVALLGILGERAAVGQLPAVLKLAVDGKDEAVRVAAIRAVGAMGGREQAATVIGWVSGAGSDTLRQAAEEALMTMGRGSAGDAVAAATADAAAKASGAVKLPLVRALGAMQRDAGLGMLRQHAFGADAEMKEVAVRAMAEWPTLAAADDLLKLAKTAESETFQVLALRGYVRLIPEAKSDEAKLAACREAMAAAKRPDDRRMVLGAVARVPLAGAVELAAAQLGDKDLARDAAGAVIVAAKGIGELTPAVRAAVEKAIRATTDNRLIGDAQRMLAPAGTR